MTTTEPDNDNGDDVQEGEDNPMTAEQLQAAHAEAAGVELPEPEQADEAGNDHDA